MKVSKQNIKPENFGGQYYFNCNDSFHNFKILLREIRNDLYKARSCLVASTALDMEMAEIQDRLNNIDIED